MEPENQSWEAWANHVLKTLEKLEDKVGSLEQRLSDNNLESKVEITEIKAKAGVWGVIAGFVASVITAIVAGLIIWSATSGAIQDRHTLPVEGGAKMEYVLPPRENEFSQYIIGDVGEEGGG